ncbi:MAG TPA: glycoside hydrolase family 140 protein [Pyrinomonadaceae bacterium]|nr:glycoside hydrolase family 140 protein [Pyrinomonadaceae bacterium]
MHKLLMRALAVAALLSTGVAVAPAAPRLRVAPGGRYLMKENGKPFFYLGDTAWELFHRLGREEADEYLRDRAAKGFTVIQAVVLAELSGLDVPNAYGHLPLEGRDPGRPNEAYFRHVDYVVNRAHELGMYVGMLPTWGDKWNKRWGVGPEIFTPENAERYGEFLGRRYRESPVIWILGGDRSPESGAHLAIVRALARGLKKGDGGRHLMTYHPMGGASSSRWFHGDDWLDFNMFQSGHGAKDAPNYEQTAADYRLSPPKPVLDGEPRYEDHPVDWKPERGWFDDFDVRQAAYWSLLSGACGHTYGNHNVWQMWQPGREPVSAARTPWRKALSQPGAAQMGHLRRLFESRPFDRLVPDQTMLPGGPVEGPAHRRAARAADGSFALIYMPEGGPLPFVAVKLGGKFVRAYWYNPRDGTAEPAGRFPGGRRARFGAPPTGGRGQDWVLVLDDESRNFPPPGAKKS